MRAIPSVPKLSLCVLLALLLGIGMTVLAPAPLSAQERRAGDCDDGIDNDNDGLTDCADIADCLGAPCVDPWECTDDTNSFCNGAFRTSPANDKQISSFRISENSRLH